VSGFRSSLTWNFLSRTFVTFIYGSATWLGPWYVLILPAAPAAVLAASGAVPTDRRWRRGCRRACRRISALLLWDLGLRIRGLVRIRARIRVLSVVLAAVRRAIVAQAAGPVGAARSAAAPLPRTFSLQAQELARQIRVWLSCLQAHLPRPHWPGLPSATGRRLCWRWRSGGPRPPPIHSRRPRWSDPEGKTRQNQRS
jgi:hypothetical protein